MTEDIYAQIEKKKNKQKKVAARSQDGFTVTSELSNNTQEHLLSSSKAIIEGDQGLVHTAKPKSIALEVSVKQEIDEYLFQHKEVSWDTLIEAAIFHALHSDNHDSIVEDAAARLAQRKISSTKRRIQTMTQNIYNQ
jgi:folate-dependent phosphoribosylglycinamide formyltransferase PurN